MAIFSSSKSRQILENLPVRLLTHEAAPFFERPFAFVNPDFVRGCD
jgi:hypothetical protein